MEFACSHCGQELEVATLHAGGAATCPSCGNEIEIPAANADADAPADVDVTMPSADEDERASPQDWRHDVTGVVPPADNAPSRSDSQTMVAPQSTIDRGDLTISQYMSERQMEGGIDLNGDDGSSTGQRVLTADQGRKYKLGGLVAQGGMGAILSAKDVNVRRDVAMKVLLDPQQASQEDVLRFIEEAQITGQLEHPSIVPLHELGVDASGNVFYTMKFVQGRTVKDILKGIAAGDAATVEEYPLPRLLTVFQRVCDAVAFAHSKRVIHRDLKPENVMVGDYGETLVMDWGLAKVLPKTKAGKRIVVKGSKAARRPIQADDEAAVDSVRKGSGGEILKTMDGAVMGTPGFMAPEQAEGRTEALDERTDIYALGGILYNILTLRPPVTGKDVDEALRKVTSGEIPHPSEFNPATRGRKSAVSGRETGARGQPPVLAHMPGHRVSDSLAAVTMKALALKQSDRYQSVKALQRDVEAYQNGFATSAEHASLWRQVSLFVKRNKTASVAAAIVLLAVSVGSVVSTTQWVRADQQKKIAETNFNDLRGTAPDLIAASKRFVEQRDLDEGVKRAGFAVKLVPENIEYRLHLANLLQASLDLGAAAKEYEAVLRMDPANEAAKDNLALGKRLRKSLAAGDGASASVVGQMYPALVAQGRFSQALAMLAKANPDAEDVGSLKAFYEEHLRNKGVEFKGLKMTEGGFCELDLSRAGIADLSPLKGMPLARLKLYFCESDLSPLRGMPLTSLRLTGYGITDLSPLRGMQLVSLGLQCERLTDLSPLKGMPLIELDLEKCKSLADLTPLRGLRLERLNLNKCNAVIDISALKGMPLTHLMMSYFGSSGPRVTDLSPLAAMPLVHLDLGGCPVADLSPLTSLPLTTLNLNGCRNVDDLSPLAGLPLERLAISETAVTDLSPLAGLCLEKFCFAPQSIKTGIEIIRNMPSIARIGRDFNHTDLADDFWKKYDAGEFGKAE